MEEIKNDIKQQIQKTEKSFKDTIGQLYFKGLLDEDLGSLEKLQKKATRYYQVNHVLALVFSIVLILLLILKNFGFLANFNLNEVGMMVLFTLIFPFNTYRYYRVKINLENKIFLLGLMDKMGK